MSTLSIIIVNYNVCSFLEQCLRSIMRSQSIDYIKDLEVWVVDNDSVDDSVIMLKEHFPWVHCIENKKNEGFAKANNKAIELSSSKYILLLNPDTVLEENTLSLCIGFMEEHPDAGGLGVKMLDGKGRFLPESKRGLPTPEVAIYKIVGLSRIFPHSARFARYYMGHLDNEQTSKIDVLSGAFMLMPKAVLEKTGYLDEAFFMYGEDIDLSYRITKAGYNNYYYPQACIIHYKGESTKKGSLNYVKVFYKAMDIFVEKHFKGSLGSSFSTMLKLAIWFRALLSFFSRIFKRMFLPVSDFVCNYGILYALSLFWGKFYFGNWQYYEDFYKNVVLVAYAAVLVLGLQLCGSYRNPIRIKKTIYGYGIGMLILFSFFALSQPQWHYSRFMMVGGSLMACAVACCLRYLYSIVFPKLFVFGSKRKKRYLLAGEPQETQKARKWLLERGFGLDKIYSAHWPLTEDKLRETIKINKISEVVFCSEDIPFSEMVRWMRCAKDCEAEYCSFSDVFGRISSSGKD